MSNQQDWSREKWEGFRAGVEAGKHKHTSQYYVDRYGTVMFAGALGHKRVSKEMYDYAIGYLTGYHKTLEKIT
jgi:hypothetical protein